MSRIGKLPISIPAGVTVTLKDDVVTVKGPKGEMSQYVNPAINVAIEEGHVVLTENENAMLDNPKQKHAFHGLYRSLVHNMVVGVSEGYKKELELVGVGYRASNQGNIIELNLGYKIGTPCVRQTVVANVKRLMWNVRRLSMFAALASRFSCQFIQT